MELKYNEECVADGSLQALQGPYKEWAEGHVNRIKGILNGARAEHTQAVKDRINNVSELKDVVSLTKGLFAVSKETAQLESEVFVQRQKVALASEVKAVLDSWVRFEQQAKESEQADLVKTVVDNVLKSLSNEKTQKDILASAVAEIERAWRFPSVRYDADAFSLLDRARQEQGHLESLGVPCAQCRLY